MSKKIAFVIAAVAVGGVVTFLFVRQSNSVDYDVATARKGALIQEVLASGTVEPTVRVDLQFKNSGEITEIRARVGMMVEAGDILVGQNVKALASQLKQSESELVNQEYKLKTIVKDETEKTDEEKNLIKAQKAIVEKARADVNVQRAKIEEVVLVSPIDGIVTAVNSEVGEIAKPETVVVSVMSADVPHIEVDVPETAVAELEIGQKTRITLDAFDENVEWIGRVTEIDPAETVKGGAVYYEAIVSFDQEDARVKPGMTANVWIETDVEKNAVIVPASAVQKNDKKAFVRVLQDGIVIEKDVIVGVRNNDGMVEIVSGISEGDRVILGDKK